VKVTEDIAYANSLGIEVGGYDLIALTRQVEQQWMAVNQLEDPRQAFGQKSFSACSLLILDRTEWPPTS
jgi:hypothetical protein